LKTNTSTLGVARITRILDWSRSLSNCGTMTPNHKKRDYSVKEILIPGKYSFPHTVCRLYLVDRLTPERQLSGNV